MVTGTTRFIRHHELEHVICARLLSIQLNGEEVITVFLSGPSGCLAQLGAVTLEELALAPDPVRKALVSVGGLLA